MIGLVVTAISLASWASAAAVSKGITSTTQSQQAFIHSQPALGPSASECDGHDFPSVVCLHRFGSVLQSDFIREVRNILGNADTYGETDAPNDPSFKHVANAQFLVMDSKRSSELLGRHPSSEFIFTLPQHSHNAPVYIPETNELMFSRLEQHYLPQLYINLTESTLVLREKTAIPPIYAPAGARYKNGLIYMSTIGGDSDINGNTYRPGIYSLDPRTGQSQTVLNNYFGWYFNGVDDLDIDEDDNIWFTDNNYGRPVHVNDRAPMMRQASYQFSIRTGHTGIVEDTLYEPNGIQLSHDQKKLFLTDTGAGIAMIDPHVSAANVPSIVYNATGQRTIYSYDIETVVDGYGDTSKRLINKTPIHYSMDYAPDGLRISREGYLLAAAGHGITVLTPSGQPVLRIQTNFTVVTMTWAGQDMDQLWAVGLGGIQRIQLGIKGPLNS